MADLTTNLPGTTSFGVGAIDPAANAPVPQTDWQLSQERLKREETTRTGDYVGSIWRQDGLVDGLVANIAGANMVPDEKYNAFTAPDAKETEDGIWDEFKPHLYGAHSAAHKVFIRDLLLQKQADLTRLGDMGWQGNVGRFALNAVLPDQLLMAMAGGWVAKGALAVRSAQAMRAARGASQLGRAEVAAGFAAGEATAATKATSVAAGVAFGAAENSAYEYLRQGVAFEHDTWAIAEAGLMGAAFTAPFALAGARQARRVAAVAEREHGTIRALAKVERGEALTPEDGKLIREVHNAHTALREFEAGRINSDELEARLNEVHGPIEPPEQWMARYTESIRAEGQQVIDDLYPVTPKEQFEDEMFKLRAHNVISTTKLADQGEAVKSREAILEARTLRKLERSKRHAEVEARKSKARELQDAFGLDQTEFKGGTQLWDLADDVRLQGPLEAALRKAMDGPRKKADLKVLAEQATASRKADRESAWAKAEADRQASISRDQESMIRSRELARMAGEEDLLADAVRVAAAPKAHPHDPVTPATTAESFVGKVVRWTDGKTMDVNEGKVLRVSPTGKLVVQDEMGELRAVDHREAEDWEGTRNAPEGFHSGSHAGAAQVKGSVVESTASGRTAMATRRIPGTDKEVPIRFDYYAVLNGSPVKRIREMTYRLIKDPLQNDSFDAQGMTASEWKDQLQRTIGGRFHFEGREAFREAAKAAQVPFWKQGGFRNEFFEMVSRVTRGETDILVQRPELAPSLRRASAAQAQAMRAMLTEAKKAGVKGTEGVDVNDFYVNRVWHHKAITEAMVAHGEDSVVKLISESIVDKAGVLDRFRKSPGKANWSDEAILAHKAKRFLGAIRALQFTPALQDIHLAGRDMGTLRRELELMNVPQDQVDDLVDLMFQIKEATTSEADAGRTGNLKFRFGLDETAQVTTPQGRLKLGDLFENDSRVLVDLYLNSMAGHTGLAKKGIPDRAAWAAELKAASDEALGDTAIDGARVADDMKLLQDAYNNVTGRPMSTADFSYLARGAAAFRGYTRSVMLPQLGIAAAFEMNKAVALLGARSLLTQLPSFRGFLTAVRQGYIPDEGLARDVMAVTGFGQEMASSYARKGELDNGFAGLALTSFEAASNKVSHSVDVLSGNASFTSATKQMTAKMAAQNLSDFAHGQRKMTDKMRERWVGQGVSADDLDGFMADFKTHTVVEKGVLKQIMYEDWAAASPESFETFQTFMSRQVRDAIQDHDLGETMPFMHTTLGKMFSELKTFFLVAHAKNFLKQINHWDATALHVWTIGFLGECLAYMTQTAVNYPHELEERLTVEKIASAAGFRMSAAGTASMLLETGYQIVSGGDSLVSPGMTANTDNRSFLKTPSLTIAGRMFNAPATLGGMTLGTDTTTRQEFRDLWGTVPAANLYGLKAAGNWWASTLPVTQPRPAP